MHGVSHNFSAPRTPQQNGVVERKNKTLQEMGRTMLSENALPRFFWAEATRCACYIQNRTLIRPKTKKTPYDLLKGRKPDVSFFRVFGCKCFIHVNNKSQIKKFDPKSQEGVFLGYSENRKAYRVYNRVTQRVEESMHVIFDESDKSLPSRAFEIIHAGNDLEFEAVDKGEKE